MTYELIGNALFDELLLFLVTKAIIIFPFCAKKLFQNLKNGTTEKHFLGLPSTDNEII